MKRGMFKVFSYVLAVVLFITFFPGNVSGKPLDLSGIGEGVSKFVDNLQGILA